MRTIVRFIGRRLFLNLSTKIRFLGRIVTIVGIVRFLTRTSAPVRRVVLARDESLDIRITKTGKKPS